MTENLTTAPPVLVAIPAANIYREDGKTYVTVGGRSCGPFEEVDLAAVKEQATPDAIRGLADRLDQLAALFRELSPLSMAQKTLRRIEIVDVPDATHEPRGKPCKTCGCDITLHHKLRCENEACPGLCNGWQCPEHKLVLCGCTYSGGPEPIADPRPGELRTTYVPGAPSTKGREA